MSAPKITTHVVHVGRNYDRYSVDIDGVYLCGPRGSHSLFGSRKEAKDEAVRRMEMPHNKEILKSRAAP